MTMLVVEEDKLETMLYMQEYALQTFITFWYANIIIMTRSTESLRTAKVLM